jgi:hypothetical protein
MVDVGKGSSALRRIGFRSGAMIGRKSLHVRNRKSSNTKPFLWQCIVFGIAGVSWHSITLIRAWPEFFGSVNQLDFLIRNFDLMMPYAELDEAGKKGLGVIKLSANDPGIWSSHSYRPKRTHTKSRKGCSTCKQRKIKVRRLHSRRETSRSFGLTFCDFQV